jgi:hypothetical protein
MQVTGTNQLMDLWHEIQMLKGLSIKPISEHSKSLLIKKYDYYRNLGGSKTDHEIEEWKKGVVNRWKNN